MRAFKVFLMILLSFLLVNICLISICNRFIQGYWWKYSHGAEFKDFLEFDKNLQVKGILVQESGLTEKVILLFFFDYMILSDKDLTNWTYYARKGITTEENDEVSFIAYIDIKQATKDGIYLNGYVVNIQYERLLILNAKKVRISGKVTTIKGIKNNTDGEIRQGRQEDRKHILEPSIEIIGN